MKTSTKRNLWITLAAVIAVLSLLVGASALYLGNYYRADEGAVATFAEDEEISISKLSDGSIVFEPTDARVGLIFYPGGKVEHSAYEPLLAEFAREGVLCVLVKMPFRLAVFDVHAADGIQEQYPSIETWYIGGHSLGGSMAAAHLADNVDDYAGLLLLASYSTADLSSPALNVVSVYGSEDGVLNREKYDENRSNLPEGFIEVVIDGGNHAQFGVYGAQKGDGIPMISGKEQRKLTVSAILNAIHPTK